MFSELNLTPATLKIKKKDAKFFVWDVWRKKDVVLTPEEWVRQHLLHNLVSEYNYPTERIAVEQQIRLPQIQRRCDAVVYNRLGHPQMIVECKEPNVKLDENVVHQIAHYNLALNTKWLLISNGLKHVTLHINSGNQIEYYESIVYYHFIDSNN